MPYSVTLIPGDGVGPEVTEAAMRAIAATGVAIHWDIVNAGAEAVERFGTALPPHVIESIRRNGVALKGPITTPVGKGFRSVNVTLRQELDLYANLRPCKCYPGVRTRFPGIDIVVVRENTEDLYAGIEFDRGTRDVARLSALIAELSGRQIPEDGALGIKLISVTASERIVRFAFRYARSNARRKVTAVHKANIMKFTDGLFLRQATAVADDFAHIEFEDRIVDNMCMQLVQKPELYDVLVMPNLYGDIVSDLCAGLVGGLGTAPGANLGDEYAVFEPIHGSAPKYAGQNMVNPAGTILSGVLMLQHIGERDAAARLERAVADVIAKGEQVTYDLRPTSNDPKAVGTAEMADAIIAKLLSTGE